MAILARGPCSIVMHTSMPDNIISNILKCILSTKERLVTCVHGKAACKGLKKEILLKLYLKEEQDWPGKQDQRKEIQASTM